MFPILNLKSCADLNMDAARAVAEEYQMTAVTVEELLGDPTIDIVINLTVPQVHAKVSMDILSAGKHLYSEKPLALDNSEGEELLALAAQTGLRVGCAPDTFLGAGLQTARKLLDDGWIGRTLAGTAFVMSGGPENWHPNPGFFYERGGGPMLDMGPYYISGLVHLLGPVQSVCAMTSMPRTERIATCQEKFGQVLPVSVSTHCSGSLLFQSGVVINIAVSFDVLKHHHKPLELYGTDGSMSVPDPSNFGGPVSVARAGADGWLDVPLMFGYKERARGVGVADMAHAIQAGRPHRCSGELALHALEVMNAFERSQERRAWQDIVHQCEQPMPFPLGMLHGVLD